MYIGRKSRYNEVVPVYAVEADRLTGGIATLIFNPGSRQM
jgi:hypothetical protein